ncbi:MAG: D-aminoacylase [Bryobacteraceae bacterium]
MMLSIAGVRALVRLTIMGCLLAVSSAMPQEFDVVLEGGRIVDGSGNPWYRGDVGIRGGVVRRIGKLSGARAKRVVRLNGEIVAPGFIDMMGGSSFPLLRDPAAGESKLRQGITTMMAGEGGSAAPQNERTLRGETAAGDLSWRTFGEYFPLLEKRGLPVNVVHNVGAAQVRRVVMGEEDRTPTPAELEAMKEHVAQAMRDGAVGLSTALIYPPGTYAKTAELVELAKVAARFGGFYSTHMRNESAQVLAAIRESMEIGEKAGLPVHIYHLKAAGEENWPLMSQAIDLIRQARARGLDVTADIYPYIRNGIGLGSFIHPRHYAKGAKPFLETLESLEVRAALRREIENTGDWENWYRHVGKNWDNVLVAQSGADRSFEGKSIQEIAKLRGTDAWTTFFDLVQQGRTSVNPKSMNEEQKHLALRTDFVSFCTDAAPVNVNTATSAHPRAFGSFPRILALYVRDGKIISLEEAIRKMTSLAANRLNLYDRGRIAPGIAADLVVFDPARIQDTATFSKPLSFPEGISYVLVNGRIAIDNGRSTGELAGRALRRQ